MTTIKHISFPSIDQYRNVVKAVRDRCTYHSVPLPVLRFEGTVKLHGTNSSIAYNTETGELWAQSRNNVITPEADNMGFARWVFSNESAWRKGFEKLTSSMKGTAVIYGEWCGQGIMKGVAIAQLPKMFVIFDMKLVIDEVESWFPVYDVLTPFIDAGLPISNVHCIYDFQTWTIDIDFTKPEASQNMLANWTQEVEAQCPVGKAFQVDGIGEGIVWRCHPAYSRLMSLPYQTDDLIFKVKGEKHSDTKVKTLAEVDPVKLENVQKFVEATVTDHRLEKAIAFLQETTEFPFDLKNLGSFLKWVGSDILKEESDILEASGLSRQDVMPKVSAAAKQWFLDHPVSYEEGQ